MTTISQRVAASADDAHDTVGGGFPGYSHTEVFVYTGESGTNVIDTGFRWVLGTPIPAGSTINSATVSIKDRDFGVGTAYTVDLHCEDSGASPATFSSGSSPNDRALTAASVAWLLDAAGDAVDVSPSFAAALQEIVDSYGQINNIVAIMKGRASNDNVNDWDSWDGDSAAAALLEVDYTAGGGGGSAVPAMMRSYRKRRVGA